MPATEYQGSSVPFASIGRSILSIRRDQVHSVDSAHHALDAQDQEELDAFQRRVADLFSDLANSDSDLLCLSWIRKLLDTFLICLEEFRVILFNHRPLLSRPPLDRLVADFFDRAVKALDVCNALRDGVDHVRHWHKHLDIVSVSVPPKAGRIGEGQLRRARKALADLAVLMLDDKDGAAGSVVNHRNRSFGRRGDHHAAARKGGHFRSLSWSVSRSWSAARQLQAIGNNLNAPRGNEISATSGFAVPVYTMNSVLLFVMWALVAAIPCQDRGLQTHFSVPRSFAWAAAVMSLHERIVEESKKRERKNSNGLMKEIYQIEKCTRNLNELLDVEACGMNEEREAELRQGVEEVVMVCESLKEGLDPLEKQVREVFHRIVRSRTEGLDVLGRSNAE